MSADSATVLFSSWDDAGSVWDLPVDPMLAVATIADQAVGAPTTLPPPPATPGYPLCSFWSAAFAGPASPSCALLQYTCQSYVYAESPSLLAYSTTTWTPTQLAADANGFWVDDVSGRVVVMVGDGGLESVPFAVDAGGAPVLDYGPPDGSAGPNPPYAVYLSPDGSFILYVGPGGGLVKSPVATASPITLLPTGATYVDGISPNGAWAIVSDASAPGGPSTGLSDLSLVSLSGTEAGSARPLPMSTYAYVLGDLFTADGSSSFAIYMTASSVPEAEFVTGSLYAVSTAAPGEPIVLSTSSAGSTWEATSDRALTGTKICFIDNASFSAGSYYPYLTPQGTADLRLVDLASPSQVTTLAQRIALPYWVSVDKRYIVYTVDLGGQTFGLYSIAVP